MIASIVATFLPTEFYRASSQVGHASTETTPFRLLPPVQSETHGQSDGSLDTESNQQLAP